MEVVDLAGNVVREPRRRRVVAMPVQPAMSSDMAQFDALPKPVRDVLNYTVRKWRAADCATAIGWGRSAEAVAKMQADFDAAQCRKDDPYGLA